MSKAEDQKRSERAEQHQRNQSLEGLLEELNSLLSDAERRVEKDFGSPEWPVVFIVGPPRSGTTLLLQWLAQTGIFGYPTNLISRFYGAPYIGAKIQRLLTDPKFDFNDEFQDLRQSIDFSSTLGKTQGLLAPNEFWYFWRRFIPNEEPRHLSAEEVERVDKSGFASSLAALEGALGEPLAMKGIILQYNIDILCRALQDRVLFIRTCRSPFYNIESIIRARVKHTGSEKRWWSVKPKEYTWLKDMSVEEQVAGQLYFTNKRLDHQIDKLDKSECVSVDYKSFCEYPKKVYKKIYEKMEKLSLSINEKYDGPSSFEVRNKKRVSSERKKKIKKSWKKAENEFR